MFKTMGFCGSFKNLKEFIDFKNNIRCDSINGDKIVDGVISGYIRDENSMVTYNPETKKYTRFTNLKITGIKNDINPSNDLNFAKTADTYTITMKYKND